MNGRFSGWTCPDGCARAFSPNESYPIDPLIIPCQRIGRADLNAETVKTRRTLTRTGFGDPERSSRVATQFS